ncbi:MAG: TraE/TraK family type IV conjugative transfer system protein [Sideroxydans sp.]|nr:TraE/TraK family type IV conjugative transfer system protein [Sideroxydans sp.]MDD5056627.1 TraE/TraK family type IV conjugative transfer system protein [Sideroxydans sp.]
MKFFWQQSTWENATRTNLVLAIVALILSVIALSAVVYSQTKHERIVLTPVVVDKRMVLGWSSADENYIKAFALSVAQLVGDLTPENVPFVVDSMSQFVHPSIYSDLRKKMLAVGITRQFRELANSTRYLPSSVEYEADTSKAFVTGIMESTTAAGTDKRAMTYEMVIKIEGGMPMIYSFDNYADTPHNKAWTTSHTVTPVTEKDSSPK